RSRGPRAGAPDPPDHGLHVDDGARHPRHHQRGDSPRLRLHLVEALHSVGTPGGCRQGPREQSLGDRAVQPSAPAILTAGVAGTIMKATIDALRGWLDRVPSIGSREGYRFGLRPLHML